MRKPVAVIFALFALTTALGVMSFRWYYRDFFYLRTVYRDPQAADRERLLAILKKGYHDRPGNAAMSLMLGEALMRAGETRHAVRVIRRQVKRHPDDPGVLWAYANALAADGRTREADRIFRDLMERLPDNQNPRASETPSEREEVRP